MMVKRANDGLLQANDGKILVNDGEMLVNDGEMLFNDGEMSIWSYTHHKLEVNHHSLIWPSLSSCTDWIVHFDS